MVEAAVLASLYVRGANGSAVDEPVMITHRLVYMEILQLLCFRFLAAVVGREMEDELSLSCGASRCSMAVAMKTIAMACVASWSSWGLHSCI